MKRKRATERLFINFNWKYKRKYQNRKRSVQILMISIMKRFVQLCEVWKHYSRHLSTCSLTHSLTHFGCANFRWCFVKCCMDALNRCRMLCEQVNAICTSTYQFSWVHVLLSNVVRVQNTHSIARLHIPLELNRIFFLLRWFLCAVLYLTVSCNVTFSWNAIRMKTDADTRDCTVYAYYSIHFHTVWCLQSSLYFVFK